MIETFTIITLFVLYIVYFRPGKTPPLNNSLVIERPGQYHMTLAPQLNLAQPFIEAVAKKAVTQSDAEQYSATQYFEVRDKEVKVRGQDCYLLAITLRNGMLYAQATSPQSDDPNNHLRTISESSSPVLTRFPPTGIHSTALDERIVAAANEAAQLRSIHIKHLASE